MESVAKKDLTELKRIEKLSSAFTLSDMEIFIFPELFYPLVLANIMSPLIWEWRKDPWFQDIEKKSFIYKVNRIKQFIIQNYVFNLDLSTWGLTSKPREIDRFKLFFDIDLLKQSNALFGYEGDKYYFDIDIRKHFGLDKYNSDIIPYWKTETIEAMNAFRHKDNYSTGAGECVSLSALYAAAMFVVGKIPLDKIFLIATPLHSQNFITEKEGLLTNNRRIVTKNMWFNGTSLSVKARRALENERVTIVSHISGYIHTLYNEATINKESYNHFSKKLREFLVTDLTDIIFINFLRFKGKYKKLFQYKCDCGGKDLYIPVEKIFEYEHTSKYSAAPDTRELLMEEIEGDEFHLSPLQGMILLNDFEKILKTCKDLKETEKEVIKIAGQIPEETIHEMFDEISSFICTIPRLPATEKNYVSTRVPHISTENTREQIVEIIKDLSSESELALLTLYVYRQMDLIDWQPFIKACIERNPVCFSDLNGISLQEVYEIVSGMPDISIYDGTRLALPDEVWNFRRGDGIEKALLLADIILNKDSDAVVKIEISEKAVTLSYEGNRFNFNSAKNLRKSILISGNNYVVE
ncbi:MAG: hypothetical protein HPY62_12245 [Bacteroidales bacterium]|nr:hypothetical protein [Bacteroidales bacterium]